MSPDKIYGILHNWKSTIENAEAEDILQYTDIDNAFCDNIVADENSSRDEIIDAYTRRFFGISYSAANNMIKLYGCGAKELISKYASKDQLSTDEQMELSALKQLVYLSEIINFEDVQILRDNYKEQIQDKNMTDINYMALCLQEEYIKRAYTKEKNSMLYKLNQHEADHTIEYDNSNIPIYKPKGDWNMLIHVVAAYVDNDDFADTPEAAWNNKDKNVNHKICTSIIGTDNLSTAPRNKNSVTFGFSPIDAGDIFNEACYDLASMNNGVISKVTQTPEFRTTHDIKDNIRSGHSEHLLERYTKDELGNRARRQPSYIISFDKITKLDKRAAKEFGIPIVLLDTKEIAKSESNKIKKEFLEIENGNITEEYIRDIILRYHNNYFGLHGSFSKAIARAKYFNTNEMYTRLHYMVDDIKKIQSSEQKYKLATFFLGQINEEKHKQKNTIEIYRPIDFSTLSSRLNKILSKIPADVINSHSKKQISEQSYRASIKALSKEIYENKTIINKLYKKEADESDSLDLSMEDK